MGSEAAYDDEVRAMEVQAAGRPKAKAKGKGKGKAQAKTKGKAKAKGQSKVKTEPQTKRKAPAQPKPKAKAQTTPKAKGKAAATAQNNTKNKTNTENKTKKEQGKGSNTKGHEQRSNTNNAKRINTCHGEEHQNTKNKQKPGNDGCEKGRVEARLQQVPGLPCGVLSMPRPSLRRQAVPASVRPGSRCACRNLWIPGGGVGTAPGRHENNKKKTLSLQRSLSESVTWVVSCYREGGALMVGAGRFRGRAGGGGVSMLGGAGRLRGRVAGAGGRAISVEGTQKAMDHAFEFALVSEGVRLIQFSGRCSGMRAICRAGAESVCSHRLLWLTPLVVVLRPAVFTLRPCPLARRLSLHAVVRMCPTAAAK